MEALTAIVGTAQVLVDAADQAGFLVDWRKRYAGRALAVVRPADTDQAARVVRFCAAQKIAIVPQGGNTGLVGGATPDASGAQIVLSTARLTAIRSIDAVNDTITVGAGCTLAAVQAAALQAGRLFPLSLASEGSCTIGGNLSTNAGGTGVLRYGNARDLCLGVEAVLPDGSLVSHLAGLRKDNTGYHWSDLLIGAEGTLGLITAGTMKLFPLPRARWTAWAAIASPDAALRLLGRAHDRCGPTLTAFELVSDFALHLVEKHFPASRSPFAERHPQGVLIEVSDHESEAHARSTLEGLLEEAIEAGIVIDAVVAEDLARSAALWALRENISEAQAAEGKNIKHDIAVPISRIAAFVATTDAALAGAFPGIRMVTFGHLGDGNLHYNVSPPIGMDEAAFLAWQPQINRLVHDAVIAEGGSISAEHGIGQLKRDELARTKSGSEMAMMRSIKRALDPDGIMNPAKVL
ncbi:MAG: FAD-binding oxidoreductase [Burkholderiaceae bacterium]